jgi:hypothetical protein
MAWGCVVCVSRQGVRLAATVAAVAWGAAAVVRMAAAWLRRHSAPAVHSVPSYRQWAVGTEWRGRGALCVSRGH